MKTETVEAVETEQTQETPFLRVWKSRDNEPASSDSAEYLGCGCGMALGKA